jgi:SAM-dependent methyltransferase
MPSRGTARLIGIFEELPEDDVIVAISVVSDPMYVTGSARDSLPCRACGKELHGAEVDTYSICGTCGSANYVSVLSAEADNATYFDEVYSDATRHAIEKRHRQFHRWENLYSAVHAKEREAFHAVLDHMSKSIIAARKSVEVGFGSGHELANYLKAGANMYGIDVSCEAVSRFRASNPQFSDRVALGNKVSSRADVLYCNALFEHLDDPAAFLDNAAACLSRDGLLLLRLPIITASVYSPEELRWDINCWKPCHRVLYTYRGLETLLKTHGFSIVESAPLAYYGYKVMSTMLRHGFADVARVRNPYFAITGLESDGRYLMILVESVFRKLICSDFAVVAKRMQ